MMKKRIFAAFMAMAMMGTMLAGCGGETKPEDTGDTKPSDTQDAGGSVGMTLVLSQRDEWLSTLVDGAENAANKNGVKLTVTDSMSDTAKQIQFVETARNNGDKVVIVNLVDPATASEIVEKAGDMKVVFVNRPPADMSILNENVVYVGSDEMTSGYFQGEALAKYFKDAGKTDVKYILLNGILGQVSTTNRTASVLKALEDNGINATEATAPLACKYDRAEAMDKISPLLTSGLEYDCIIANNDAMALGAIEALENINVDPSEKPIVGIDCTADGAAAVASGKMFMTVFQNADGQGNGAIMAAVNLLDGKAINEGTEYEVAEDNANVVWIPFEPVDKDNVANYQ